MNTKVLLVCSLLLLAPFAQAASNDCILSSVSAGFCTSNTCDIGVATLATLCAAISTPLITLNLQSAVTVNINGAANFNLAGLTINANASSTTTVNLNAAVAIAGDLIINGKALVKAASGAVVTVSGKVQVAYQSTLEVAGNVTVTGTVVVYGGIHLAGTLVNSAAQTAWLVARSSSVSVQGSASGAASITGNGGIDANVELSANVTVSVGNSPGVVYINGDLSMSSTTTLEIDVDSVTSYDKLIIKGAFKRNGILYADFENGYKPDSGTIFIFATHASSQGSFSISHGNFGDSTFDSVHPQYETASTSFKYGSAANVAIPFALIALCLLSIVF